MSLRLLPQSLFRNFWILKIWIILQSCGRVLQFSRVYYHVIVCRLCSCYLWRQMCSETTARKRWFPLDPSSFLHVGFVSGPKRTRSWTFCPNPMEQQISTLQSDYHWSRCRCVHGLTIQKEDARKPAKQRAQQHTGMNLWRWEKVLYVSVFSRKQPQMRKCDKSCVRLFLFLK